MIRIASGWSNMGGSTVSYINLTNALNEAGFETVFHGPHEWHRDKCRSGTLRGFECSPDDSLVVHFLRDFPPPGFLCRRLVFSSQEQHLLPVRSVDYGRFDAIHYLSERQRLFHDVDHPFFLLPNILDDLRPNPDRPEGRVAGVVGSVDANKRTHLSVARALEDGCDRVLLFGPVTDHAYFDGFVRPLLDGTRVAHMGQVEDRQAMYDMLTDVYHSSVHETWGNVKGECLLTGVAFHGNESTDCHWSMPREDIVAEWVRRLV